MGSEMCIRDSFRPVRSTAQTGDRIAHCHADGRRIRGQDRRVSAHRGHRERNFDLSRRQAQTIQFRRTLAAVELRYGVWKAQPRRGLNLNSRGCNPRDKRRNRYRLQWGRTTPELIRPPLGSQFSSISDPWVITHGYSNSSPLGMENAARMPNSTVVGRARAQSPQRFIALSAGDRGVVRFEFPSPQSGAGWLDLWFWEWHSECLTKPA